MVSRFESVYFAIYFLNFVVAVKVSKQISNGPNKEENVINLGFCKIVLDSNCPHSGIRFYLYSPDQEAPEEVFTDKASQINFNPSLPTKIIVHGYNSDMHLEALKEVRKQYLLHKNYNIFTVDWSPWAKSPCYPAAVWNSKIVGKCLSKLIEVIKRMGADDIHAIGFSLGAHVLSYTANYLSPYKLPRITGLDPAMPGFATVPDNLKLDKNDAEFVDVIHTNAFFQGTFHQSGHIDFYVNGGISQPGCWVENRFFACNHHRAPLYFAESINTKIGFWAWPCPSYLQYLIGNCPPTEDQILMGEHTNRTASGMHLVITSSVSPYALGKYTGPTIEIYFGDFFFSLV